MSQFNKIMKAFESKVDTTAAPSFKEAIYVFKKPILTIFDESGIISDLNFLANVQLFKIPGYFHDKVEREPTNVGPKYRETINITSSLSADLKNQLMMPGHLRLCAITIKEDKPVELYGTGMGLYYYDQKFETIDGFQEPSLPKEICITTADGTPSIEATIAAIEKLAILL